MKKVLLSLFLLISIAGFAQVQKNLRTLPQKSAAFSDTTFAQNGTTQATTAQSYYNLFGVAGKLNISDTSFLHAQIAQTVSAIATKLNIADTSFLHNQIAQAVAAIAANTTAIATNTTNIATNTTAIAGKQPLENQRLSTTNLPQFTGVNVLPQVNLSTPSAGFNITDSTGAGATFIFPSGIRKSLNWSSVTTNAVWKFQNKSYTVGDSALDAANAANINSYLVATAIYTSGSTYTVSDNTNWIIINPASAVSALAVTFPANPINAQRVDFSFGGTLTNSVVVNSFTVNGNSGQSVIQPSAPSNVQAGETISYRYNSSLQKWYRIL